MTKKIHDLKIEIDKEIEVFKKAVIKMEWESPITHIENAEVNLESIMNQAEHRISELGWGE